MTTRDNEPALDERSAEFNWKAIAKSALGSALLAGLVGGALQFIGQAMEAEMRAEDAEGDDAAATTAMPEVETGGDGAAECADAEAARAAALLGVEIDANDDAIRAALRARIVSSQLHPDQGGDGEEAKRLIAAKNLLIERARARR